LLLHSVLMESCELSAKPLSDIDTSTLLNNILELISRSESLPMNGWDCVWW
jgi:hypothetical protein